MRCCWTKNVWINTAVTTASLVSFFHMKHFKLTYRRHNLSFGLLDQRMCVYLHAYNESEAHKFSEQTELFLFSLLLTSLTPVSLPHTHTHTAITLFHLQLCIFTTSHLVSHTAITLSSKHPLQQLCVCFGCVGDTRFARFSQFLIIQQLDCHFTWKYPALINNCVIALMCCSRENTVFIYFYTFQQDTRRHTHLCTYLQLN